MTTRSSARFCYLGLEMVSILSAAMMVMIITTITITILNFVSLWRWIWGSYQAILFVSSDLNPHLGQTKQPPYTLGKWYWECVTWRITFSATVICFGSHILLIPCLTAEAWMVLSIVPFVIASHVLRWWNLSHLFSPPQSSILSSFPRDCTSFFDTFFIAPVIRISDDDQLPRKCFAHIHHSLLVLESLTLNALM